MRQEVKRIIEENARRHALIERPYHPLTGEGAPLEREPLRLSDFALPVQWLPKPMFQVPLVKKLKTYGSIEATMEAIGLSGEEDRAALVDAFLRLRSEHDFFFWAAFRAYIKSKGGGEDILFVLNRPQRKLILTLEEMRLAGKPIRLILLKARQWGGSTAVQIYMAWLQLVHKVGLNSLIVGHVKDASTEVKDMLDRLIASYPLELLYDYGADYDPKESKMVGVGNTGNIHRIPQRNCKIKIGTAEKPDSARGGDYNLVHCTEVGLWKTTEGKTPEQIVRSATSGVLYKPYTMIIYESTANGTGNFFQREWDAAVRKESQFYPLFVSWFEIDQYSADIDDVAAFAEKLWDHREDTYSESAREEAGRYLWGLWEKGATLEAIHWYILERSKYNDHGDMASEFPSDSVEAFVHSGARVFDKYKVEELRKSCRKYKWRGDIYGDAREGADALKNLRFAEDNQGQLEIWAKPEKMKGIRVTDRYLVVVDIGGRSHKADWSVICVFDRLYMNEADGKPSVVAQWYGHIDMDILAWKSAQIAKYYDNALLVIESNTLETHDKDRSIDGDQSSYILNQIRGVYNNLYARKQSAEEIRDRAPKKYGFHTNVKTKPEVISTLIKVIRENLYTERDERCVDEYLCYERKKNGAYGAIVGKHDDLLMTRAIGLHICYYEMDLPKIINEAEIKPVNRMRRSVSEASIL